MYTTGIGREINERVILDHFRTIDPNHCKKHRLFLNKITRFLQEPGYKCFYAIVAGLRYIPLSWSFAP